MVRHRDWRCGFAAIAVVACCVACSSAPGGAASPAAGARTAVATKSGTSGPALAEVTGFGGTVSTPTPAALGAMQAILISTPAARYGGVTLGGGGGIIVAELAGTPDPALDRAVRRARAAGVSVEVIPVSRSMSALESLRDGGVFRALPVGLRDHADQTQVDIAHNRVVVGFDVPLTDPLRATVAAIFGSAVAVAAAQPVHFL